MTNTKTGEVAIKVDNVYKSFKLPHEKQNSIKGIFLNMFNGKKTYEKQQVLEDISFEVKKGEFFGIVGRNGSGKSTLLKLISQIYTPDSGSIRVNGKLVPFIELGVGFNPELTGRQNVFLNGALLGFNHQEMMSMYEEIVEFAELEKFMDQKLKNYSSGMQVRLAFSIAIRANTEILVLDEVLAVGDESFQRKCTEYFESVKKTKKTVILVSHSMDNIERYCSRAMLVEKGKIKIIGSPESVSKQYILDNLNKEEKSTDLNIGSSKDVSYIKVISKSEKILSRNDKIRFIVEYKTITELPVYLGITLSHKGISLMEHNTLELGATKDAGVIQRFEYEYKLDNFNDGEFMVGAAIFSQEKKELLGFTEENTSIRFIIKNKKPKMGGLLYKKGLWSKR